MTSRLASPEAGSAIAAQASPETAEDERPAIDKNQPKAVADRRRTWRNRSRVSIRSGALMTPGYFLMNALAAVIASYGLMANSPAVVIGAMIVALLLGPIMGVALALSDGDLKLLRTAAVALVAGGVVVFSIAVLIGLLHSNAPITAEITSRTQPNLFDLAIALAGGAAGAYATVSSRVSAGFVGVAIATALVPPLCASAILLTRGEFDASAGAFLLAGTNIVSIQFAAAIVLFVMGYAREEDGAQVSLLTFVKRHAVSLMILGALAVTLAANLKGNIGRKLYENEIRGILSAEMAKMEGNRVQSLEIVPVGDRDVVRVSVSGPREPTIAEVGRFSDMIPRRRDSRPVDLRVRYIAETIITPEGIATDVLEGPLEGPPVGSP